ncbi:hypothetical protein H0X48_02425 [Candidatus Dependentiae bacterium]|nr:hypothetical protein [Candidatus Dependentiae bacterium]
MYIFLLIFIFSSLTNCYAMHTASQTLTELREVVIEPTGTADNMIHARTSGQPTNDQIIMLTKEISKLRKSNKIRSKTRTVIVPLLFISACVGIWLIKSSIDNLASKRY